jgi:hypothetical protein
MNQPISFDRRKALAGAVVAGVGATATVGLVYAQDSTPEASPSTGDEATPDASSNDTGRAQVDLDVLNTSLELVQADLDAVRDQVDATTIETLLAQATDLIAQVQTASDAGTTDGIQRNAFAAIAVLHATSGLIHAQITYPGLPSEEARSSRILAHAFEAIEEAGTAAGSATDIDTSFYITTAQSTYTTAYDLYTAGSWAQAALTAKSASGIAAAATILTSTAEQRFGFGMRGVDKPGGLFDGGMAGHQDKPFDDDDDPGDPTTPVEVPAPDFGT